MLERRTWLGELFLLVLLLNFILQIVTCPSDLYFDVEYNRCEYKDYIPICSGSPRPDSATTTTTLAATTTTKLAATTTVAPGL